MLSPSSPWASSTSFKIDIGRLEGKENWETWRCKVMLMLRGTTGGLDAINSNLKVPKEPDSSTASSEDLAAYQNTLRTYNEINNAAMFILMANVSDATLQKVMRFSNAKQVWDELHTLFDGTSEDKSYTLCYSFFSYRKDPSHDMSTHISKLKNIWHELKAELQKSEKDVLQDKGKHVFPEILVICKILETLPDESYFPFKSSLL